MKGKYYLKHLILLLFFISLYSCRSAYQNKMFQHPDESMIQTKVEQLKNDYLIQPGDEIALRIYTRKGAAMVEAIQSDVTYNQSTTLNQQTQVTYMVSNNGNIELPIIGEIRAVGLKESELQDILEARFKQDYNDPYVFLKVMNRRAFVFTANRAEVVPLNRTPTSIFEVLAKFDGLDRHMSSKDIMIIRKENDSTLVYPVNLETFDGISKSELTIQSNDIIYIPEKNRALYHSIADITPIITLPLSIVSATISTILLFYTITR